MISICIIEDIEDIHEGLVELIKSDQRLSLVGAFYSGEEALKLIPRLKPHVVLTDINLPGISGVETMRRLLHDEIASEFLMFTIFEDTDQVFEALQSGAKGYILKTIAPEGIITSLIECHEGGSPMSPNIARKVISSFNQVQNKQVVDILTHREFEVLNLLAKGYLYKEIADQLDIAISTVKRHINHIYTKLQVQNKTEALNRLYDN